MNSDKGKIIPLGTSANDSNTAAPVLYPYRKKEKHGFCTPDKQIVIPCIYENTNAFSEGLAAVMLMEKVGYIDLTGKMTIPYKYDFGGAFKEGLAVVERKGKYGFIDATGKEVIPLTYDDAEDFTDGLAIVEKGGLYGFINKQGKVVIPLKYDLVCPFVNGVSQVELKNEELSIDMLGNVVPEPQDDVFYDGLTLDVDINENFGFRDADGNIVVPHIYDWAHEFAGGRAAVCKDELWGFIDTTGKVVVPLKYKDVYEDFDNGLALVEIGEDDEDADTELGYIDENGVEYWED
jgi:hypothetical protein